MRRLVDCFFFSLTIVDDSLQNTRDEQVATSRCCCCCCLLLVRSFVVGLLFVDELGDLLESHGLSSCSALLLIRLVGRDGGRHAQRLGCLLKRRRHLWLKLQFRRRFGCTCRLLFSFVGALRFPFAVHS